jgi:hypothetical protein
VLSYSRDSRRLVLFVVLLVCPPQVAHAHDAEEHENGDALLLRVGPEYGRLRFGQYLTLSHESESTVFNLREEQSARLASSWGGRAEIGYTLSRWHDTFAMAPRASFNYAHIPDYSGSSLILGEVREWRFRSRYMAAALGFEVQVLKRMLTLSVETGSAGVRSRNASASPDIVARGQEQGLFIRSDLGFRLPLTRSLALGARVHGNRMWAWRDAERWRAGANVYFEWGVRFHD